VTLDPHGKKNTGCQLPHGSATGNFFSHVTVEMALESENHSAYVYFLFFSKTADAPPISRNLLFTLPGLAYN
jgi:hypothetical protein